jgi:hypothetical protein
MRHDAHYVDELLSPRTMPPTMTAPAQPAPHHAADSAPGASALPALLMIAGRLESLVAHTSVIGAQSAGSSLIAQSVQTEFARLARVARAAVIVNDGEMLFRRTVSLGEIADLAAAEIAPGARLGGIGCEVSVEDRGFTLQADPIVMVQAVVAAVDGITELLQVQPRGRMDPRHLTTRVTINVQSTKVRPAAFVEISCPALAISARHGERFFENHEEDYRTTPAAGLLLASAAYVARAHGGRSEVKRSTPGIAITFVYPQASGDPRLS